VSRVQARVALKNTNYFIENIGQNPIYVNGRPSPHQLLENGDEIVLGKTRYLLRIEHQNDIAAAVPSEEKTMLLNSHPVRPEENLGPRIVCTTPAGRTSIHPLTQPKIIIGRSAEADVSLNDPLVSRRHCVIEKRAANYIARNLSTSNPLFVNDHAVSSKRLYSGDQLKIGSFSIAFISDRPEDIKNHNRTGAGSRQTFLAGGLRIIMAIVFVTAGYFFYMHGYIPWRTNRAFEKVLEHIASGENQTAQSSLIRLMQSGRLDPEHSRQAKDLMAKTALAISQQKAQHESVEAAQTYLISYLMEYGGGEEAEALWDRLDYCRLTLGKLHESRGDCEAALQQFAAIRTTSLYFPEAQQSIRQIWLSQQQRHLQEGVGQKQQDQALAYLLQEAEAHFAAKRYLTPVNRNAYAVYQAVLALEPENSVAIDRIERMKAFYRNHGNACQKNEQWHRALTYFERYRLIDPEDTEIKQKIEICRKKLDGAGDEKTPVDSTRSTSNEARSEQREEIRRLLEASGKESSWIMRYLFEEETGESDAETPW